MFILKNKHTFGSAKHTRQVVVGALNTLTARRIPLVSGAPAAASPSPTEPTSADAISPSGGGPPVVAAAAADGVKEAKEQGPSPNFGGGALSHQEKYFGGYNLSSRGGKGGLLCATYSNVRFLYFFLSQYMVYSVYFSWSNIDRRVCTNAPALPCQHII